MKINIGLIGTGGLRGHLAKFLSDNPNVNIIGGTDIRNESIEQFHEAYGTDKKVYKDYQELLKDPEINTVFIITPDYLHKEHAVASLKAGKAVYLEKPLALSIEDCDLILETAYQTKSKLFLGHNMRYFPVILKMKEIIDSGVIGDIQAVWCRHFVSYGGEAYFKDWHSEQQYVNGLLLQKGAHDIDVIHWLSGGYSQSVVGMGKLSVYNQHGKVKEKEIDYRPIRNQPIEWPAENHTNLSTHINVEDHSMIMMQLDNGVQASYMQCMYSPDSIRNYTFIGTKGRIENRGDHGDAKILVFNERHDTFEKYDIEYNLYTETLEHGGSDPKIVKDFIDFLLYNKKPNISPIAARMAVATGVMATESLRGDNSLKNIPPLPMELQKYFEQGQIN